jgi:hypothetical protein
MFIVVVTLGLLAIMGVYGLSATRSEVTSAGHMREALQGQKAGEAAMVMAAETFNPSTARGLFEQMSAGAGNGQTTTCKTTSYGQLGVAYSGLGDQRAAEACITLDETKMAAIATKANVNPWASTAFSANSFGPVPNLPFISIEVTNPIDVVPTGTSTEHYAQVTATVSILMKPSAGVSAQTAVVWRGQITVGPVSLGGSDGGGLVSKF